jgi:hypothetical protein
LFSGSLTQPVKVAFGAIVASMQSPSALVEPEV